VGHGNNRFRRSNRRRIRESPACRRVVGAVYVGSSNAASPAALCARNAKTESGCSVAAIAGTAVTPCANRVIFPLQRSSPLGRARSHRLRGS